MIRTLRKRHVFIFVALAVLLPLLVILGLCSRPSETVMDEVPASLDPTGGDNL